MTPRIPGGYVSVLKHCGHHLVCKEEDGAVMIECIDCKMVIIAFDKPVVNQRTFKPFPKDLTQGGHAKK